MPKEIATKTENGPYYKCTACLPAEALAKEGGLCLPRSQLCCTTGVRIGGKEEDRKVIKK